MAVWDPVPASSDRKPCQLLALENVRQRCRRLHLLALGNLRNRAQRLGFSSEELDLVDTVLLVP